MFQQQDRPNPIVVPQDAEFLGDCVRIDMNGKSIERLTAVLALVSSKFVGYSIHKPDMRIVLYSYLSTDAAKDGPVIIPFMAPLDARSVAGMIFAWLSSKDCVYPSEPDHDGTNDRGWRVHADDDRGNIYPALPAGGAYTRVSWGACAVVSPDWLSYGK